MISPAYQLSEEDIERHHLDQEDIGKWCLCVRGCIHIFNTAEDARKVYHLLNSN